MKIHRLSLTAKLTGINLLLASALMAVISVAWCLLPDVTEVEEVRLLQHLQHTTQHADMLHDALHADVLAVLLAAAQSGEVADQQVDQARRTAQQLRLEMTRLEQAALADTSLQERLEQSRQVTLRYADSAEDLVQGARHAPARMPALRTRFETDFDATEQALAAQTATIASALDSAGLRSGQAVRQARLGLIAAALLTIVAGWSGVATIARSIRNSLMGLRDVAQAVASGDLERRSEHLGRDEVGQLAEAVNDMADALHRMIERMRSDGSRIDFSARLAQALDMADTEAQAHGVVAQAMLQVATDRPMELLLADSSEAHLERAAAHPAVGAPGCCVDSPFSCVAVRRGHAVRFSSSEALDACPRLRGRTGTPVSASCVPVTFMGRALGVLHVTSQAEQPLDDAQLERLVTLAAQAGGRIGMVRAFERTQMQAATDALTGLPNRRTAEARLRRLVGSGQALAFVMADLDHFKRLNDMHGHQAGDEALRTFADVVRECARPQDLVCRWGGEEFAFVLAGVDAAQALHWCERLRSSLQDALQRRSTPVFTASLGVCVCGTGSTPSPESLVAAADAALYQAKSAGRDRAVVSRPGEAGTGAAEPRISEQAATIDISQLVSRT